MKFLVAFVAIVAVATSAVVKPVGNDVSEIGAIIAAINHPSTDPATAQLLEQQLFDILGLNNPEPEPIAVGPVIVDPSVVPEDIAVGPAIIDFPLPDGGAVTAVDPTPVQVGPAIVDPVAPAAAATPLVQIIVNVAQSAAAPAPVVVPEAVVVPEPVIPEPVIVVEEADNAIVIPAPVVIPPPVIVTPVEVVDSNPNPEPILVIEPTFPVAPAVVLPDILN